MTDPHPARTGARHALLLLLTASGLAACAGSRAGDGAGPLAPVGAERSSAPSGDDETLARLREIEEALAASEQADQPAAGGQNNISRTFDRARARPSADRAAPDGDTPADGPISALLASPEASPGAGDAPHAAREGPEESARRLAGELASALQRLSRDSSAPAASLVQLAALELLAGDDASPDPGALAALSPNEREFLRAWRGLFSAARARLDGGGDVWELASEVVALAERMEAAGPLTVRAASLCTRVDGFGAYTELPRTAEGGRAYPFVAGRRHRVILYTELTGFTAEPDAARADEGFVVRLSQALELVHFARDADTVVWSRPAQDINDFSRSRRRDFFVTQVIDLPPTLSVGAYRLKATITDRATGSVAEAVVPLVFVAEPAAAR